MCGEIDRHTDKERERGGGGWVHMKVLYYYKLMLHVAGLTQQQLLDSWKREVEKAFPARAKGEMNFQLYKLAGKREVGNANYHRNKHIQVIARAVQKQCDML